MWDPNLVLDYWRAHPPSTVVTKRARAVSLAMLAIYCRPSDLARFSVAHTVIEGDTLRYRIRGPKERRNAGYLTPVQRLEMLPADSAEAEFACPVRALLSYWDSISDLEKADDPRGVIYSLSRKDGSKIMSEDDACGGRVYGVHRRVGAFSGFFTRTGPRRRLQSRLASRTLVVAVGVQQVLQPRAHQHGGRSVGGGYLPPKFGAG